MATTALNTTTYQTFTGSYDTPSTHLLFFILLGILFGLKKVHLLAKVLTIKEPTGFFGTGQQLFCFRYFQL
jgi:hypothetical protein